MILVVALAFSVAGYAAIHYSHAQTTKSGQGTASQTLKVMPLGDSVTVGDTALPNSYRLDLWRKLVDEDGSQLNYVGSQSSGTSALPDKDHEGHTGWHIDQLNENVTKWLATYQPDEILLQAGASDLLDGASASEAISRLDSLLNTISNNSKSKIYVGTLTPLASGDDWNHQSWREYNATLPQLVASFRQRGISMVLVDFEKQGVGVGEQDMAGDGLFLSNQGYEKMTAEWHDALVTEQ